MPEALTACTIDAPANDLSVAEALQLVTDGTGIVCMASSASFLEALSSRVAPPLGAHAGQWVGAVARATDHSPRGTMRAVSLVPQDSAGDPVGYMWLAKSERDARVTEALIGALAVGGLDVVSRLALGGMVFDNEIPKSCLSVWQTDALFWESEPGAVFVDDEYHVLWLLLLPEIYVWGQRGEERVALGYASDASITAADRREPWATPVAGDLDPVSGAFARVEWTVDEKRYGEPVTERMENAILSYQAKWRATEDALRSLNEYEVMFGGKATLGELAPRLAQGAVAVDVGEFADHAVWTTRGALPAGEALENLAYSVGAALVPTRDGVRLEPSSYALLPEPLTEAIRMRAEVRPDLEYVRMLLLAVEQTGPKPFAEHEQWVQDVIRARLATMLRPPIVVSDTQVMMGLNWCVTAHRIDVLESAGRAEGGAGCVAVRFPATQGGLVETVPWPMALFEHGGTPEPALR